MCKWIQHIWKEYAYRRLKKDTLLILDHLRSHSTPEVLSEFEAIKTTPVKIPPGLTSKLQPLDRSINKSIKDALKKIYV